MKTKVSLLILMSAVILATMLAGCAASDNMAKYRKLQRSVEYNERYANNTSFTIESVREDYREAKKELRQARRKASHRDKIAAIVAKTQKVKEKTKKGN